MCETLELLVVQSLVMRVINFPHRVRNEPDMSRDITKGELPKARPMNSFHYYRI